MNPKGPTPMVTQQFTPRFGLRPRAHDPRELRYRQLPAVTAPDPSIDRSLEAWLPEVYQQEMGDCVANATCTALLTVASMGGFTPLTLPSRLANYSWGRQDMGSFPEDSGMWPQSGLDAVRKRQGVSAETLSPYANNPAYDPGAVQLQDCPNQDWLAEHQPFYGTDAGGGFDGGIMTALDEYRPVLVGMEWYEAFTATGRGGILPAPGGKSAGYHEVCCYGRHPTSAVGEAVLAIRNSWGRWFGADGDFFIPVSYLSYPGLFIDMRSVAGLQAAPAPAPSVTCTIAGPTTLAPGATGTFTLGASGATQPLWFVAWGDGSTTEGWKADNVQSHAFASPRTYTVTAWVWDAATQVRSEQALLTVEVTTAPAPGPACIEQLNAVMTTGAVQQLYQRQGSA
jgi:hypothetical protein